MEGHGGDGQRNSEINRKGNRPNQWGYGTNANPQMGREGTVERCSQRIGSAKSMGKSSSESAAGCPDACVSRGRRQRWRRRRALMKQDCVRRGGGKVVIWGYSAQLMMGHRHSATHRRAHGPATDRRHTKNKNPKQSKANTLQRVRVTATNDSSSFSLGNDHLTDTTRR